MNAGPVVISLKVYDQLPIVYQAIADVLQDAGKIKIESEGSRSVAASTPGRERNSEEIANHSGGDANRDRGRQ